MNGAIDDAIENENVTFDKRLSYDKLVFFYISLPTMLIGNMMGALLLCAIQLNVVDMYSIVVWLLISFIMFSYGLYQYSLFKNESEENKLKNSNIWFDKYYTNTLINGIIWGSSAFLMFPETPLLNQMIVVFFLFAIGFSAMGVLASKKDLLLTYILVTYLPILLRLFFMEGKSYITVAYVILALTLIMVIAANYYGEIINNALKNRQHFITIKHSHEKLKERFFSLFEHAPVGIYYYNKELKLEDVNKHFIQMNKIGKKEDLIGADISIINNDQITKAHNNIFAGKTGDYRGPFETLNNKNLYVKLSTVPMINADGEVAGGITIINDITNEVTAKEKMIRNAYYDLLTNIPNRTLLMDKLKSFIFNIKDGEEYSALLFMGIDNFKKVNETFGHDTGDSLLKQVVQNIEDVVKSNEVFARITGDKFVILLPNLDTDIYKSEKMSAKYIKKINKHFIEPLSIAGEEYHLSFTTGIILFNKSDASAFDLLKRAETAMYEAKNSARGTTKLYKNSMGADTEENLMIENDIHKALKNGEFSINYQPQFDIEKNKIMGAEALIRWKHPIKGNISPSKFIPIAEESGAIIKLEEWIFDQVLGEMKTIVYDAGKFPIKYIAINVSTVHFLQPHFVEKFMLIVDKYKIDPKWVQIEITESGVMRNIDDAIRKIKELKKFGFTFSIDDFGTGYSSLAYLKKLPIDTIKIDQSFILSMNENRADRMIVESVVTVGQKFNLKVLAEGVENSETLEQLRKINCDLYQGNYGYKPMALKEFLKLV